jgi:hypothetical protein
MSSILASNRFYAGGGGGHSPGQQDPGRSSGGLGGGGQGGRWITPVNADDGAPNTGGGGGGSYGVAGSIIGLGGSGIVVVRYRRNASTTITPNETRSSYLPYFYFRDVRPIIARDGLVLELDAANPLSYSGTGTIWNNLSRDDLNGTLVNGPVFIDQHSTSSIGFDGSNDFIRIAAPSSAIPFGTGLTHEVWIYPTDYTDSGGSRFYLIDPRGDGTTGGMNSYFLYDYVSAPDTVRIVTGNSGNEVITPNFSMPLNRWHHIAATRSGSNWAVYFNGEVIHTGTSNTTSLTLNNSFRVATFANGSSGQYFFEGRMSVARLYSRGLSESEVQQNFNATRARYGV